jgi:transcriptional regulator with XRE-family HTH domain
MVSLTNEQDVLETLARCLREERIQRGWRQVDLAIRSGVPVPTLRKFESTGQLGSAALARLLVSLGLADRLVEALKVAPAAPAAMNDFIRKARETGERRRVRRPRQG